MSVPGLVVRHGAQRRRLCPGKAALEVCPDAGRSVGGGRRVAGSRARFQAHRGTARCLVAVHGRVAEARLHAPRGGSGRRWRSEYRWIGG
jgi:hypothetical protein